MIARSLAELSNDEVMSWRDAFHKSGCRIQQSPCYALALQRSGEQVGVAHGDGLMAVFTVADKVATVVCADIPVLSSALAPPDQVALMLREIRRLTGLSVYMPLVDASYRALAELAPVRLWARPPNSVIDWADDGAGLLERARIRGGSQIDRKRRLIERDGLILCSSLSAESTEREVLAVDDRSWKAAAGQSLRQRGRQAALYAALIGLQVASVTFLRHNGTAVAFRIDAQIASRLMCLKWSYDQAYARYSPGTYLLTTGLIAGWAGRGIRTVDLCGSPDHLKDLIYSHRVPRIDVWYGDGSAGRELEQERLAFDARLRANAQAGKGLRHAYP